MLEQDFVGRGAEHDAADDDGVNVGIGQPREPAGVFCRLDDVRRLLKPGDITLFTIALAIRVT